MPGSPDPVLGSELLTRLVAVTAATLVVVVAAGPTSGESRRLAAVVGAGYATICVGCWAGARLLADAFASGMTDAPLSAAGYVLLAAGLLAVQAAVPVYAYRRYGAVVPLLALTAVTYFVVDTFLRVRGETDPLGLYALIFGPLVLVGLGVLVAAELAARWLGAYLG